MIEDAARHRKKAVLEDVIRNDRRAVLVVNTRSRDGRRLYSTAKRLLTQNGISLDAAYPVRDPARLPAIVQHAIEQAREALLLMVPRDRIDLA